METLSRAVDELLGRASGPFHFRLILQPVMATVFAVRAGIRDAREDHPAFLRTFIFHPGSRKNLAASAWKDVGKVFILAIVLDTAYQLIVLHAFRSLQTLIVAIALALIPYALFRGPAMLIARLFLTRRTADGS
jgi:hypothetical protein